MILEKANKPYFSLYSAEGYFGIWKRDQTELRRNTVNGGYEWCICLHTIQELQVLTSRTIAIQVISHKWELNKEACGYEQFQLLAVFIHPWELENLSQDN